ncbi:hypothetical protein PMZ80_007284 [Knufia obscura]|uniref:F-box domain-containing protein n=2 Tax=Knufia TaxID=430999 RepID=A0AAN8ETF0_9EURO|nr:hypothetical protein PMZ80_007284 [Knufia obscura]KAK5953296.1 hypothetical protein OHC33_005864 [Knufia fluminis]
MPHINDLPQELLASVFQHLHDCEDWSSMRVLMQVCHLWSNTAAEVWAISQVKDKEWVKLHTGASGNSGEIGNRVWIPGRLKDRAWMKLHTSPISEFGGTEAFGEAIRKEEVRKAKLAGKEDPANRKASRTERQKKGVVSEEEMARRLGLV